MDHCADPTEFREYWKRNYGPTIAVYPFNEDRPERVDHLDRDLLSLLTILVFGALIGTVYIGSPDSQFFSSAIGLRIGLGGLLPVSAWLWVSGEDPDEAVAT